MRIPIHSIVIDGRVIFRPLMNSVPKGWVLQVPDFPTTPCSPEGARSEHAREVRVDR